MGFACEFSGSDEGRPIASGSLQGGRPNVFYRKQWEHKRGLWKWIKEEREREAEVAVAEAQGQIQQER
jgi:hypothetical protein